MCVAEIVWCILVEIVVMLVATHGLLACVVFSKSHACRLYTVKAGQQASAHFLWMRLSQMHIASSRGDAVTGVIAARP